MEKFMESTKTLTLEEIKQEKLKAEKLQEINIRKLTTRYYNNPHDLFIRDTKSHGVYVELLDDFVYPVKIGKFDCYMSKYGRVWRKSDEDEFYRVKPIVTNKKEYIMLIDENHQRFFFVWDYLAKVLNTLRTRLNKEKINYE